MHRVDLAEKPPGIRIPDRPYGADPAADPQQQAVADHGAARLVQCLGGLLNAWHRDGTLRLLACLLCQVQPLDLCAVAQERIAYQHGGVGIVPLTEKEQAIGVCRPDVGFGGRPGAPQVLDGLVDGVIDLTGKAHVQAPRR